MPHAVSAHILFIDAYDSFSNNIIALLETRIPAATVTVIKIDEEIADFPAFLRNFDAVVAGPGPGHPEYPKDIGHISRLWQLDKSELIPVLGICLGFQSLVLAFGGTVTALPSPLHGVAQRAISNGTSIFRGLETINPVHYHSLHARSDVDPKNRMGGSHSPEELRNSTLRGDLEPLAWVVDANLELSRSTEDRQSNPTAILVGIKHRTKPFSGVQFHPESICSDHGSRVIIDNWWSEVQQWHKQRKASMSIQSVDVKSSIPSSLLSVPRVLEASCELLYGQDDESLSFDFDWAVQKLDIRPRIDVSSTVIDRILPLDGHSVPKIYDILKLNQGNAVVLDSEPHQRPEVGTHSIVGALEHDTPILEYRVGAKTVDVRRGEQTQSIDLAPYGNSIFEYLKAFMEACKVEGNSEIPFWGGLVGYISYEACLETIGTQSPNPTTRPDISFAYVERSVVIDHQNQKVHVQSIKPTDDEWVDRISSRLAASSLRPTSIPPLVLDPVINYPSESKYCAKIRHCQEYICKGDSYELCLTNQATVQTRHLSDPWPLYLRLRSLNAAPFSAYVRLGAMTVLSSSPERFIRWTRPMSSKYILGETTSTVQFRPIKGTVKRYPSGPNGPAISLSQATEMLSTTKERAENLMIVDLIRHDLHGVVGSGNVCVPKLMVVEEYATLFQLVTVVEGTLISQGLSPSSLPSLSNSSANSPRSSGLVTPPSVEGEAYSLMIGAQRSIGGKIKKRKTGIDVLAASLPPGSMTGAPKCRSCTLLGQIEESQPRGIYSGVMGYMDVGGGGDFSVVIRSAFRWDNDSTSSNAEQQDHRDTWNVGAGGAITSLSTEDGEWEEMMTKLGSTLRMFE
ncbi:MAG: hypothetical protein Q9220_006931 [cf. Caloplaca sp. 1 TL-2023]